jgi:hypothetical protein
LVVLVGQKTTFVLLGCARLLEFETALVDGSYRVELVYGGVDAEVLAGSEC